MVSLCKESVHASIYICKFKLQQSKTMFREYSLKKVIFLKKNSEIIKNFIDGQMDNTFLVYRSM